MDADFGINYSSPSLPSSWKATELEVRPSGSLSLCQLAVAFDKPVRLSRFYFPHLLNEGMDLQF